MDHRAHKLSWIPSSCFPYANQLPSHPHYHPLPGTIVSYLDTASASSLVLSIHPALMSSKDAIFKNKQTKKMITSFPFFVVIDTEDRTQDIVQSLYHLIHTTSPFVYIFVFEIVSH
jgi:hypothetical protein